MSNIKFLGRQSGGGTVISDTLEQRIAKMLAADDARSCDLTTLIAETEAAAAAADETAKTEREKALDPALSPDPRKARTAMEDAEFTAARLRTVLPRLQARCKELQEQEHAAAWKMDFNNVKAQRDQVAEMLRERYPLLVNELAALMACITPLDAEITRVNSSAPYGDYPRLRTVELTARNLERLEQPNVSIPLELRLPYLDRKDGPLHAWPPPMPNLAVEFVQAMPADNFDWRNWHEAIDARDRQMLADNRRQIAEAEARQRDREAREAAEARTAAAET